ncbi:MAG TPA: tetratricopeptide repeat protein [Candidatus Angelobacter sp.]|nr:tetratricopeptide repeat protein [Candidatus Angelobacter sp.]
MSPRLTLCSFVLSALSIAAAQAQPGRTDVCPRDPKDFAAVQQKAAAGDPAAETALASCYDLGQHVQPDGKESIRLLTKAAGEGYVPAQYEVGRIYLYGRGVTIDYARALLWEGKAADQGDPRAQRDLAFMYERGFGVSADPAEAAEWNRKAAAQGNAEAQLQLARALDDGAGVSKDAEAARKWYGEAARQEQPAAQLELARESAGQGNCPVAAHWYQESAGHGQAQAMYELGRLYLEKCGPNKALAFTWFSIGARFGSEESRKAADEIAVSLTAAQKKRLQLRVAEWIKEHPGSDKQEDEEEKR